MLSLSKNKILEELNLSDGFGLAFGMDWVVCTRDLGAGRPQYPLDEDELCGSVQFTPYAKCAAPGTMIIHSKASVNAAPSFLPSGPQNKPV